MKKLMTMLATAAMAFGLYADKPSILSGAGFDSSDKKTETPSELTWNTSGFVAGFWTGTNAENAVITTGGLPSANENRPAFFVKSVDPTRSYSDYLAVATKPSEEIGMNVKANGGAQLIGADGLYFDGLVKFTAFDEFPTIANDAKIAVFPMLNDPEDESAGTNLYVKAWGTSTNIWKTATSIDDEDWHRVTIKAISDILAGNGTQVGFVVYVDGQMIGLPLGITSDFDSAALTPEANYYNKDGFLFGALGAYNNSLTQVGFSGKGGIDEIVFTVNAPNFAKSPTFATINVGSYISSFTIYENGVSAGTYTDFPITIEKKDGVAYTYTYIAAPGYVSVKTPTSLNLSQGSASIENAAAAVAFLGEEGYATIAAAVNEANKATEQAPALLKLITATAEDNIEIGNSYVLLDLNGQTIGNLGDDKETSGVVLSITNSNVVADGIVKGYVNYDVNVKVSNVKFDYTNNSTIIGEDLVTVTVPEGYELKPDAEDPHQYYVITERPVKGTVIFICGETETTNDTWDVGTTITFPTIAETDTTIGRGWFYDQAFKNPAEGATVVAGEQKFYAKVVAAVAKVGTEKFETVVEAFAKVQDLETAGTYPITVTALVDNLAVTDPSTAETITLGQNAVITIEATRWTFEGTVSGTVTLAAGKSIKVPEGSPLTVNAPAGYKVVTTPGVGDVTYTVVAIQYATLKVVAGDANVSAIVVTNAAGVVVAADTQFDIDDKVVVAYKSATFASGYELDESKSTLKVTLDQASEATITVYAKAVTPAGPTSDAGTIGEMDPSTGIAVFIPTGDSVTEATVNLGASTAKIAFPKQVKTIKGVPAEKIVIKSGAYDITAALAFTGNSTEGITYDLNPDATVATVPVKPTIAAEDANFDITGGTLEVKGIAGLYYTLVGKNDVTQMATAAKIADTQATETGATVSLTDNRAEKPAAQFYQIKVTIDQIAE